MFRRIRSSVRRFRALLIALVLACTTIQPAMLSACDLHDLAHASSSQVDDPVASSSAHPGDRGEGATLLHAMFHAAHCCAHAPVLLPPAALEIASVRAVSAFADPSPPAAEARSSNLFRPPIAG